MKTKIVYVLVSSDKDIYLEQAWASIFSLRHFNKNAFVTVVCDNRTGNRIKKESPRDFKKLIDEIIEIPFDETVTNRERSRFLKTSIRGIICGDFLFIDTDTIITADLSEIDNFNMNIGMVYDWHCKLAERPNRLGIVKRVTNLFDIKLRDDTNYFNSGVIYSKDTQESHDFFSKWHDNWMKTKAKPFGIQDQQSLTVTVNEIGGVTALSGNFNCQPIVSISYLSTAKIVHFFNTRWTSDSICPFYNDDIYLEIKKDRIISETNKTLILNCRSTFVSPTMVILGNDINIWRSPAFKFLKKMYYHHSLLYKILNKLSKFFIKTKRTGF